MSTIMYRWAENQLDRFPRWLPNWLPTGRCDRRERQAHPCASRVKATVTTVPIVFIAAEDPVKLGLVDEPCPARRESHRGQFFQRRIGCKATGAAACASARSYSRGSARQSAQRIDTERPCCGMWNRRPGAMGLQIQVLNASTSHEIDAAFAAIVNERSTRFLWVVTPSWTAVASSWSSSRTSIASLRHIRAANTPTSAD